MIRKDEFGEIVQMATDTIRSNKLRSSLTVLGIVQIWMVLLIAIGRGIVLSFNQPARQSLISELVPREDLKNAIQRGGRMAPMTAPSSGRKMISER